MILFLVFLGVTGSVLYIFRKKLSEILGYDPLNESEPEERSSLLSPVEQSLRSQPRTRKFAQIPWSNTLLFSVNGKSIEIVNPNPDELLATYLREKLLLKGTKLGCEEGGCGACSVVLRFQSNQQDVTPHIVAVNSCLRLLCANDGLSITTVEGIGSTTTGLSVEQKRLVANNGTQCGYCTPGWITSMHALLEQSDASGQPLRPQDIEKHFDGNICRCTGYRPIMQAFHSLCHGDHHACRGHVDRSVCRPMSEVEDIEGNCHSYNDSPSKSQLTSKNPKKRSTTSLPMPLYFFNPATGKKYFRPVNFSQLLAIINEFPQEREQGQLKFLAGNTAIGVTKYLNETAPFYYADDARILVDVNQITELLVKNYNSETRQLTVGAAVKISDLIQSLQSFSLQVHGAIASQVSTGGNSDVINHHSVFSVTAHHLYRIANTQVRNAGSWAGNFLIYLKYKSFPSDALIALTNANAVLHLADGDNLIFDVPVADFLNLSYEDFVSKGYVIVSLTIQESSPPTPTSTTVLETQKVAIRERNAHAYVNAGFNFTVNALTLPPICVKARIIYGGVSNQLFVAKMAESALLNQPFSASTFSNVLNALNQDLTKVGINTSQHCDTNFLISTMQNYLYLAFLRAYPIHTLPHSLTSAVLPWSKPISRGVEVFPVNPDNSPSAPIGKPVTKLEAPIQATGQATYPSDEQLPPNGYHGAIVFATQCAKRLLAIDTSAALGVKGVVAVLTAVDVPGVNDVGNSLEVFVSIGNIVPCVGAPIAVVIAEDEQTALKAVQFVAVTYETASAGSTAVTNIDEAISRNSFYSNLPPFIVKLQVGSPAEVIQTSPFRSQGRLYAGGQYHFYMEAQSAFATLQNGEDITVVCGTQDPTFYASQIGAILGMTNNQVILESLHFIILTPLSQVKVECERTGGAFGGKIRSGMSVASIAALAAKKLGKSVRLFNQRTWDMNMQGGREDWLAEYQVGYDSNGLIQAVIYKFYVDAGCAYSDTVGAAYMGMEWADNAYYLPNYAATLKLCYTNTPARTSMRAPGVVHSCYFTESIVEHVATSLGLPLNVVQERNFLANGLTTITGQEITNCTLQNVWSKAMSRSFFQQRYQQITSFNSQNLWRKRGIACAPSKYGMGWAGYNAGVTLGVRSSDGSIVVTHSGTEIGQGINTKVAQAVAMALGVDLSLIKVERASTHKVVNGGTTGGSGTSEAMVQAALNACANLNLRLDPYRPAPSSRLYKENQKSKFADPMSTSDWVSLLSSLPPDVSLNVEGWYSPSQNPNGQEFQYYVYAACVTEVELNVLTGEVHILSSELVYDCGSSLNPAIDIGQIEGAFVTGLGWFFHEKVEYASGTGMLKSIGTWEYKPPLSHDIPSLFNVTLIKNAYNTDGILGSKAVGEPPMITANGAFFATKMAIASSRRDAGATDNYFELKVPCTVDVRQQACLVSPQRLVLPY